jgi:hypothetical protein
LNAQLWVLHALRIHYVAATASKASAVMAMRIMGGQGM